MGDLREASSDELLEDDSGDSVQLASGEDAPAPPVVRRGRVVPRPAKPCLVAVVADRACDDHPLVKRRWQDSPIGS